MSDMSKRKARRQAFLRRGFVRALNPRKTRSTALFPGTKVELNKQPRA